MRRNEASRVRLVLLPLPCFPDPHRNVPICKMNATFDRSAALRGFRLLKKQRNPAAQWLRITAVGDNIVFASGVALATLSALILEPGAFTTRRVAFERLLRSYTGTNMLTLQADAGRFRIGSFSGQLLDYEPHPAQPTRS